MAAALAFGGYWLRRWIVPDFSGSLARLAELTIAVALLILTLQLLGVIGILRLGWIIVGCVAVGLAAAGRWRRAMSRRCAPRRPTSGRF